ILVMLLVMASPILGTAKADELASEEDAPRCSASGVPLSVYVERENLVLAAGSDAIHSHESTRIIFDTAWTSSALRELRRVSEATGHEVLESRSVVVINVSAGMANVFIPVVEIEGLNLSYTLIAIVDAKNHVIEDAVQTSVGWEEC
ncbi:MAG: hypothetical protein ACE5JE_07020, partial [Thermoplasmata archaeon]